MPAMQPHTTSSGSNQPPSVLKVESLDSEYNVNGGENDDAEEAEGVGDSGGLDVD